MQEQRPQQQQGQPQQPKFVGIADLAARWHYTRQGVHHLSRSGDFPAPFFTINAGRVKVWQFSEIEDFESRHPEVTSPTEKRRKVYGYFRAVSKGKQQEAAGHGA